MNLYLEQAYINYFLYSLMNIFHKVKDFLKRVFVSNKKITASVFYKESYNNYLTYCNEKIIPNHLEK